MRARFVAAIERLRAQTDVTGLIEALRENRLDDAARIMGVGTQALEDELQDATATLRAAYAAVAVGTLKRIPKAAEINMRFDLLNPKSVEFLRRYEFNLVRGIDEVTRRGIRTHMIRAFEQGIPPERLARDLVGGRIRRGRRKGGILGLTERQQKSVELFRETLQDEGIAGRELQRRVRAHSDRLLLNRARTLARTETIRAATAGQDMAFKQAVERGLIIESEVRRFWIVTPDDRLCPICEPIPDMNPKGVRIDGLFNTPVGAIAMPPAHPQCRCAVNLEGG